MPTTKQRKAPRSATPCIPAAACEFGEYKITERDGEFVARAPVRLTASAGTPFLHGYWGRLVVDVEGVSVNKDRVTIDWCHDRDEVLGYGAVERSDGTVVIDGELVSTVLNDRAHDVMRKGAAGVPYEASLKLDPANGLVIEYYEQGAVAEVNGQTFEGPITVFRESLLRGVAMCPYGADPGTEAEFTFEGGRELEFSIKVFEGEKPMTKKASQATDQAVTELTADQQGQAAEPQQATTAPQQGKQPTELQAPVDPLTEFQARVTEYAQRFGPELGARWAIEAKPIADAYAEFVERLTTEHSAQLAKVEGELAAANDKLRQVGEFAASGEAEPVSSEPAPSEEQVEFTARAKEFEQKGLKPGLARFAAGLRIKK